MKAFKAVQPDIVHIRVRRNDYKGFEITDKDLDDRWIITRAGEPVQELPGSFHRLTVAKNNIDLYLERNADATVTT